eukprot:TRINITY_DN42615_c0_g1_i1.p1 TRINITY_DN42615_c0_g1~~TRINITY_DN42615_c0_g1_i1.p1  ORF type:complete len:469 (-),score=84.89 TRINITY_DN42615_c0_g1_i1:68-1474(-)
MAQSAEDVVAKKEGSAAENVYLLWYAWNQDFSCFVCGTTAGFRVFALAGEGAVANRGPAEVCRREHSVGFQQTSVMLVAMLYKTNIFAMVTQSCAPNEDGAHSGLNKVQIWDERKQKFIGELRSRNEVKGVCLKKEVIVMVCEYAIYVYTCDQLKVILHLTTGSNKQGLCVLAVASDPWLLCCPGQSTGAVRVQVGQDAHQTHVFQAHLSALAALALNASGSLVATASETGTVVKVFQTSDGHPLYRLRRSTRPAVISSLAFRNDDCFLAAASSSSTVHIFKLDESTAAADGDPSKDQLASPALGPAQDPADPPALRNGGYAPAASTLTDTVSALLPKAAAEAVKTLTPQYFKDLRSFAQFRLPDMDSGQPAVDTRSKQARILGPTLAFHKSEPRLFVLHYNGVLYECSFKPDYDLSLGHQECGFVCATTWFATRPDFKISNPITQQQSVPGGAHEGDEEAEEWQLVG